MSDEFEVFHRDGRRLRLKKGDILPDGFSLAVRQTLMDHQPGGAGSATFADSSMAVYDEAYAKALPDALRVYGLTQDDGSPAAIAARGRARLTVLQSAGTVLADAARQRMIQSYNGRPKAEDDAQGRAAIADAQHVSDGAYDWFRTRTGEDARPLTDADKAAADARAKMIADMGNAWKGGR